MSVLGSSCPPDAEGRASHAELQGGRAQGQVSTMWREGEEREQERELGWGKENVWKTADHNPWQDPKAED